MLAHYTYWVVGDQGVDNLATKVLGTLSGLGMPLFFVLSGFVIHYNYRDLYAQNGGLKAFVVARFTRLYPLYIVLLGIEFYITFKLHRGSCGHAGERWALFLALPYYLTLTQDWIFGIIGKNNLIYQYYMCSAVSWSISLEIFFYFSYPLFVRWLNKQEKILKQVLWIVLSQFAVILYITYCYRHSALIEHIASVGFGQYATEQHGYQDSLQRWLLYFNPWVNLPAFFCGALIANMYLKLKEKPLYKWEQAYGGIFTLTVSLAVLSFHFFFYLYLAPTNGFIGRTASLLIVPGIALLIFCLTRYSSTLLNRFLSISLFIKLGEASYSIYLLHAFFGWYPRDFYFLHLNPWLLYILAVSCILIISRFSYLLFERPVQRYLRKKMLKKESFLSPSINPEYQPTPIQS